MKANLLCNIVVMSALTAVGHAQTINWGSDARSWLLDSGGAVLDANNYSFELGIFNESFVPTDYNIAQWGAHWTPVSTGSYSQQNGVFGAVLPWSLDLSDAVGGKSAYMWVHNSSQAVVAESMLAHAPNWTLPTIVPGNYNISPPLDWVVSDLDTSAPLWGGQGEFHGAGAYSAVSPAPDLQTHISIFSWTIDSPGTDPGDNALNMGNYNVLNTPDLTGSRAIFKILLGPTDDFGQSFWDTNKQWENIFSVADGSDLATIFNGGFAGDPVISQTGVVAGQGHFAFSGSTLIWSVVPEPSGAVVALLMMGGLLRRRRNSCPS